MIGKMGYTCSNCQATGKVEIPRNSKKGPVTTHEIVTGPFFELRGISTRCKACYTTVHIKYWALSKP